MAREEREQTAPAVFGGGFVVADAHGRHRTESRDDACVMIHVAVACLGVDDDVVLDGEFVEQRVEATASRPEDPIPAAIAAEHRADAGERLGALRDVSVEARDDVGRRARRIQQRKATAHAEACDTETRRVDLRTIGEPAARGVDGGKRGAVAARERAQRAKHTQRARAAARVEVRRERRVTSVGETPRDAPDVVVEAEDLVEDQDARHGLLARSVREREEARHLAAIVGVDLDHEVLLRCVARPSKIRSRSSTASWVGVGTPSARPRPARHRVQRTLAKRGLDVDPPGAATQHPAQHTRRPESPREGTSRLDPVLVRDPRGQRGSPAVSYPRIGSFLDTGADCGVAMNRRDFLKATLGVTAASLAAGLPGCRRGPAPLGESDWWAGEVAHLLPTVSHERVLVVASFRSPRRAPQLRVAGRAVSGEPTDSSGAFFRFDARGLEPATAYELSLHDADGTPLCDPWPLRTFPAPDALPQRFRLLSYTCAGGSDLFLHPTQGFLFQPTGVRQRLLARALSFAPDAAIANGDHVYWDIQSRPGLVMARSPQAWWEAGRFDRAQPIFGTPNEAVLKAAFGPQIAGLYGTRFRSLPMFFVQDDHDYTENDEATDTLRTLPPDAFMLAAAKATQRLYYPELLTPAGFPAALASGDGLSSYVGALRYGRLFEGLVYDCRRFVTNQRDPARSDANSAFLAPNVERWLLERTARGETLHAAHVPSTPILWTAGKWGEWYPDTKDANGELRADIDKPYWPRGWLEQHDRLLAAASARRDRVPLFVSGDLHATGAGRILRSGALDLRANPVVSVLSGTPGSSGPTWPSSFRGQKPTPSGVLDAEEWVAPLEENGFTLLDFDADGVRLSFFRWRPEQGVEAIDTLEPFRTLELPRGGAA